MSLESLMNLSSRRQMSNTTIDEARLEGCIDGLRDLIAYWRAYPDRMVDMLCELEGNPNNFHFYVYQRFFLRAVMRHRYVYATYPRAYSKSFLSVMCLILRCILYPNAHLFVTTGGKEQAASITLSKVDEICRLIPWIKREIDWTKGETTHSKDDVKYKFKNGSILDILQAKESSRGQRRVGGLMEECVLIDQKALNEIVIPTTNVNRLLPDGTRCSDELVNKSQVYITTAGWKNSFAYDKLIELLIQSVIDPDEVMVIGGTYQIPVWEGLLDEDFVDTLKLQGTYAEDSFGREYKRYVLFKLLRIAGNPLELIKLQYCKI